jgi:hypothetical protein
MSTLWLKIIACAAMLVDHLGYFSGLGYSEYGDAMRAFGRIAFPIFCYLIAFGYRKTSNKYKYLIRLLIVGLISELPFRYCFYGRIEYFTFTNVYYTLALGLSAIIVFDYFVRSGTKLVYFTPIPVIAAAILAELFHTDYGADGVLLIFFFYISGTNKLAISASGTVFAARKIIYAIVVLLYHSVINLSAFTWPVFQKWDKMQFFAILALLPILYCNGSRGYSPKSKVAQKVIQYSFYLFYPVHLLIIGLIIRLVVL